MKPKLIFILTFLCALTIPALAQENLQREAQASQTKKTFTTVKELPITSVKNQYRSGTCWDFGTLGYFESEILRKTGKTYDLCEMFVVNKDYMDNATHYVRMHGYSQISEGGSCDDVLEVIRQHGICPENAMPAPGSLVGDTLANFKVFFPELTAAVRRAIVPDTIDASDLVAAGHRRHTTPPLARQRAGDYRPIRRTLSRLVHVRRKDLHAAVVRPESRTEPRRLCQSDQLHPPSLQPVVRHRGTLQMAPQAQLQHPH